MRLEFYPVDKLKRDVLEIVGRHLDLNSCSVFFFGSRVAGKGDERSDIDVGIEGQEAIAYQIMAHIRDDIENLPILYKIEVVDFKKVSKDFKEVALQHTEAIS
ncbi:MAG: nucleotidyltransferase domain-containing protein [Candidatus Omnitrophica bacterium]|nr:nucleotidyltransferase domain-containing protein [Candidatus Omnitrophota bacterium]